MMITVNRLYTVADHLSAGKGGDLVTPTSFLRAVSYVIVTMSSN